MATPGQTPGLTRSGERLTLRPANPVEDAGQVGLAVALECSPRAPADDRLAVIGCDHGAVVTRLGGLRGTVWLGARSSSRRRTGRRRGSTMTRRLKVPIRMDAWR